MGGAIAEAFELRSGARPVRRGLDLLAPRLRPVLPTGLAALDALLPGGGLPEGRLVEVTGRRGSGKLTLALAVAARLLARDTPVALVDPERSICPDVQGEPALERLLVVRGGGIATALRATDALLRSGAFALLVLDLPGRAGSLRDAAGRGALPAAAFVRLTRETAAADAVLLVVSEWLPWRTNGLASLVSLRLEVSRVGGQDEVEVRVAKSKLGDEGRATRIGLRSGGGAGLPPDPAAGCRPPVAPRPQSFSTERGGKPCVERA